jgi:hypothetical protein
LATVAATHRRRRITRACRAACARQPRPAEAAKLFADALDLLGSDEDAERRRALIGLDARRSSRWAIRVPRDAVGCRRIASLLETPISPPRPPRQHPRFTSLIGDLDDERIEAIERALSSSGVLIPAGAHSLRPSVAGAVLRARLHTAPGAGHGGDRELARDVADQR